LNVDRCKHVCLFLLFLAFVHALAVGQNPSPSCTHCAEWNQPQAPFRVFGNTYYVGTHGLSSILITSDSGHVLIDGDLQESVQQIVSNIRSLGFRIEDVKLILNSHVHFDHAGGIAERGMIHNMARAGPFRRYIMWTNCTMGKLFRSAASK
jgi:glyoxylase-like metal-dependent hydrolase (beta-lactamase superfamily II)